MKRMLMAVLPLVLFAPALRADERALDLPIGDPERKARQAAVVLDGITDAARGDLLTPPELAARLDAVSLLFVGESHTDIDFHRVQLRVIQELHRRGRRVLVGLEMYPVTEQHALDRWHSDERLGEDGFLSESHWYRHWGYHWNYYRDIFLFARASGIPMFGVNVPRAVVQTVRANGFEALTAEEKALLPPRVDTGSAEHHQLVRAFFGAMTGPHGSMPDAMFEGMYRAQCTWDAAMGWNALQALRKHGDGKAIMVVLTGSGHVAYGLGAERQAKLWFQGRTASVIPVPIAGAEHPETIENVQASYADFVWGLPPTTDPLYPTLGISTPEQKTGAHYKVIMVEPDSPAVEAGFRTGDELLSLDGVDIDEKETANRLMADKRWGDSVVCRVLRDGSEKTLTAYLRRQPPKAARGDAEKTQAPRAAPPVKPPSGGTP
jgi:uncharacterized iron-regulated protein